MSPFGVSSALPDENSSNSLIMDSIHESSTLPITVSENTSQSSQTLNESICPTKSPNRAYSQFTSSKVVMVSPVKSVNTELISCSTSETNLTLNGNIDSIVFEKSPGSCDLNETNEFCFELEKQNQGDSRKQLNDTPELKVVVQAMPTDCGNISALKQVIHDTISRKSWLKMKSKQNRAMARKKLNGDRDWNPGRSKILKEATNNTETPDLFSVDCSERKKLNPRLCFDIEPGDGMKLSEIQNVASAIRMCSDRTKQVIHYLLFNTYGGVGYDKSIKQTLRNILEFSGYPFKAFSSVYNKKYHCLIRLPYPMLLKIYNILVQRMAVERSTMVNELMKFCMKPVRTSKVPDLKLYKVYDEKYLEELKKGCAMNGPYPLVMLEKLNESHIKLMEDRNIKKEKKASMIRPKDILNYFPGYVRPSFIQKGPGRKLKEIPHMTSGIFKARRRIINLIHCLLFKKPGSLDFNRLNILEFSGFLQCDSSFLERKLQILMKYKKKDLDQIFNVFPLNSTESRLSRMKNLLLFLQAPYSISKSKRTMAKGKSQGDRTSKEEKKSCQGKLANNNRCVTKLRDIEKVCLNIECSPPRELAALNDLLFIKPCDISELHEKVLNFTPFQFDENSTEFHYRKTLLYYMNFGEIRKIAHILDINNWENYEFPEELSAAILNFLLKLEQPVQGRKRRRKQPKNCIVSSEKCRPTILMVERDRNIYHQENPVSSSLGTFVCNSPNNIRMENDEGNSNTTVVIQRISDSSYSWTDSRNDGPITISDRNSDECLTLNEFAHHPTESQLEIVIKEEICSNSWNISTGDLLNKVHHHYPRLNLTYRNDFIKSKALEILHEMQECMVDSTFDE